MSKPSQSRNRNGANFCSCPAPCRKSLGSSLNGLFGFFQAHFRDGSKFFICCRICKCGGSTNINAASAPEGHLLSTDIFSPLFASTHFPSIKPLNLMRLESLNPNWGREKSATTLCGNRNDIHIRSLRASHLPVAYQSKARQNRAFRTSDGMKSSRQQGDC